MAKTKQQDMWAMLSQLEVSLNDFFLKKFPLQLPKGARNFIVWVVPYLTILGVVLSIPAILALLGISALFAPALLIGGGWTLWGIVSLVAIIATAIIQAFAIPGLFAKKKSGWDKLFWVSLIGIVSSLISGNLVGVIIGTAINWFFLFQIRSYYK